MDLIRSIQVFQKVAELQNFSRAAENLNLVPSAVSRQVSELEKWVGVRLLNRTTRSLRLTDDGQRYLEKFGQITDHVDDLRSMKPASYQVSGKIKLTAPMMLGQYVLPKALARFKRQYPQVHLDVILMNRMADLVEEGFDVAVRAGNLADSGLVARKIGSLKLKTVATATYLDIHGHPRNPGELTKHNCLINSGTPLPDRWEYLEAGKKKTVKVHGDLQATESLCLKAFSMADLGIARLPEFYVEKELVEGKLVELLPEYAPHPLPINIIHLSRWLPNPAVRIFIDFLAQDLRTTPIQ